MSDKTGVAGLRQAIDNQWAAGEACFLLPIGEATAICDECEDELVALSWAKGVPVPRDADGAVVPLAAEELYTNKGEKVLVDSICFNGFFWYVKDLRREPCRLDRLHRGERDSWEKLEEDVARIGSADYPCDYFNHAGCGMPCYSCPANTDAEDCIAGLARDVLRRAKALAGRDAKAHAGVGES